MNQLSVCGVPETSEVMIHTNVHVKKLFSVILTRGGQ